MKPPWSVSSAPGRRPSTRLVGIPLAVLCVVAVLDIGLAFATTPACDGGMIDLRAGSEIDLGWTGISHDDGLAAGATFGFAVARRCADDASPCHGDEDCGGSQCVRSCDCVSDTTCELTGPVGPERCLASFDECTTNADCGLGPCVALAGPTIPLSSGGAPVCIVPYFASSLHGTLDVSTGEMHLDADLRWHVSLGDTIDRPCARCGSPEQEPAVGETFTCEGGPSHGATCTVDAVSSEFGGISYDCPSHVSFAVGGPITLRLSDLTTDTTSRTAQLPCKFFGFQGNPLNPASNPKCTDRNGAGDPVCTSNADCRRCTGDTTIACDGNDDCAGAGECAEAPEQPITCGFWCQCGFCNGNGNLPCFENADCPEGQACVQGTGTGSQPNSPQQRPNACDFDKFTCNGETERCATTTRGSCSEEPWWSCTTNEDCSDGGVCEVEPLPCFGPRITRAGSASPLGAYCTAGRESCSSNGDCGDGDTCTADAMAPDLAAVTCTPATTSSAVNAARGLTGPAAFEWKTLVQMCRCDVYAPECEVFCSNLDPCGPDDDGKPCDDGIWCNGTDTCSDGSCSAHSGDACDGPGDLDGDCSESCDESSRTCNGTDPDGSSCSDRYSCTKGDECAAGACVPGPVDVECSCGDWTRDGSLKAGDAQGILKAAVNVFECEPWICDWNGSGDITASDALAVLRASVDLPSTPSCPEPG